MNPFTRWRLEGRRTREDRRRAGRPRHVPDGRRDAREDRRRRSPGEGRRQAPRGSPDAAEDRRPTLNPRSKRPTGETIPCTKLRPCRDRAHSVVAHRLSGRRPACVQRTPRDLPGSDVEVTFRILPGSSQGTPRLRSHRERSGNCQASYSELPATSGRAGAGPCCPVMNLHIAGT